MCIWRIWSRATVWRRIRRRHRRRRNKQWQYGNSDGLRVRHGRVSGCQPPAAAGSSHRRQHVSLGLDAQQTRQWISPGYRRSLALPQAARTGNPTRAPLSTVDRTPPLPGPLPVAQVQSRTPPLHWGGSGGSLFPCDPPATARRFTGQKREKGGQNEVGSRRLPIVTPLHCRGDEDIEDRRPTALYEVGAKVMATPEQAILYQPPPPQSVDATIQVTSFSVIIRSA